MPHHILILHNIRSAQNVGAMFRTAEAAGIHEVIISGYSAAPKDRFGRPDKKVSKSALGAEEMISWRRIDDLPDEIKKLQDNGYTVSAIEQSTSSTDYKKHQPGEQEVLIMGNEVTGVESEILGCVDHVLEIPMSGEKESLNVSVACGIVLFRLFDR